jgi:hypothetical protein
MLVAKERPRAIRTLRGWAIHMLQEAGALRECEEHGWAQDRADPHAPRARLRPRPAGCSDRGISGRRGRGSPRGVDSIGDTCPECLPDQA